MQEEGVHAQDLGYFKAPTQDGLALRPLLRGRRQQGTGIATGGNHGTEFESVVPAGVPGRRDLRRRGVNIR